MCLSCPQMRTRKTAEPTNANQNGAVTPYAWASRPPRAEPTTRPAEDADRVHASHAALELGRHGALPDRSPTSCPTRRRAAPKTKKMAGRDRRRGREASPRCVSVSMMSPMRMMLPRLTRRVIQPYATVPTRPPIAETVVDQPEATVAQPEPLGGVEHEHRPCGSERDVEDEDRQHQRPDGGVVPDPAEALGDLVADRLRRFPDRGHAAAARSGSRAARPPATSIAWPMKGSAMPIAKSAAPIGGPASWLRVTNPPWIRELPSTRSSRSHEHRQQGVRGVVGEHLGRGDDEERDEDDRDRDRVRSRSTAATRPSTIARSVSTDTTINRRSRRSDDAPAHTGRRAAAAATGRAPRARRGTGRWSARPRSSGPAARAMPSPRLLIHDDARSQRKPTPRRAGARVSTRPLTGRAG